MRRAKFHLLPSELHAQLVLPALPSDVDLERPPTQAGVPMPAPKIVIAGEVTEMRKIPLQIDIAAEFLKCRSRSL